MPARARKPAKSRRVAVVVSRYNAAVTDALLEGALDEARARGVAREDVVVVPAPGAFEVPALCLAAAKRGDIGGVVALGCIIKGETIHDRVLADAVTRALLRVACETMVPVSLGVLTVNNAAQARARAGGKLGNKGAEAMGALLDTMGALDALRGDGLSIARAPARPDKTKGRA